MISAEHARPRRNIEAEHLSKIWRIDLNTAKITLDAISQHNTTHPESNLTGSFTTNDRMLWYKRIKEHFFMDNFFATINMEKYLRGSRCCQLFLTDKGFVYVVPMKSKNKDDILSALKQLKKEIGVPEVIICDGSGEQTAIEVKKYCGDIGTTLRILEEGTPWSNTSELYIGLIKESVGKYTKETDSPLVLWEYCAEKRSRINNLTAKKLIQLHGSTPQIVITSEEGGT